MSKDWDKISKNNFRIAFNTGAKPYGHAQR